MAALTGLPPEYFEYMASQRAILVLAMAGLVLAVIGAAAGIAAAVTDRKSNPVVTAWNIVFGLVFIIAAIAFS